VLTARGLDAEVVRIGLGTPVDPTGAGLTAAEATALDLARCLVRRPDIIVVERALSGLPRPAAAVLLRRLRQALIGRGLIAVLPDLGPGMEAATFDGVVRVERGAVTMERAAAVRTPVPA
jgi:ABC-type transport system involved in cytochrome bd biosynthesis fused ATPase/permease subunit